VLAQLNVSGTQTLPLVSISHLVQTSKPLQMVGVYNCPINVKEVSMEYAKPLFPLPVQAM